MKRSARAEAMKAGVLTCLLLFLPGCATIRPATGLQWGYFGESDSVPSLKMVLYAADRPICEIQRAKQLNEVAPGAAWAKMRVESRECVQLMIDASGSDYWVLGMEGSAFRGALGFTERDWCMTMKRGFDQMRPAQWSWGIACEPVGVTPRGPKAK